MAHRPGLTTDTVVRAAAGLVDAEGPEALNLARLAGKLGVRTPSLYNHITSLDDVRRRLALYGARELEVRLARSAIGKTGDEGIFALAEAYRGFAREHPGVYAMGQRAATPDDRELVAAQEDVLAIMRAVLAPSGLEGAAEVHALRALRSLAHGFVSLELAGGFGIPVDVDESYRVLVGLFLDGLRSGRVREVASSGR